MFADAFNQPNLYSTDNTSASGSVAVFFIIYVIVVVALLVASWKAFTKAGRKGWEAIIPFYNLVVLCQIVGLSGWFLLLFLVPFVNLIFSIYLLHRISKSFGHGAGMTILQILLIGQFIIAFGKSQYVGPNGQPKADNPTPPSPTPPPPAQPTTPAAPQPPAPVSPTPAL